MHLSSPAKPLPGCANASPERKSARTSVGTADNIKRFIYFSIVFMKFSTFCYCDTFSDEKGLKEDLERIYYITLNQMKCFDVKS